VIWVFISEIFPDAIASGMALGSLTHWVLAAIINVFPHFAATYGGGPYYCFLAP
jgi:hypothetical protein